MAQHEHEVDELSLQALREMLDQKADKEHTHTFIGSIESALSLNGVNYSKFVRNDLGAQSVMSYQEVTSLALVSNTTSLRFEAGQRRALVVVGAPDMTATSLHVTGQKGTETVVNVHGELLVNENKVLTVNDAGEVTGINFEDLDIDGKGIIVSAFEPDNPTDGMVWAQVVDEDLADDIEAEKETMELRHAYELPVGSLVTAITSVTPNGYLRCAGQEVSRSIYGQLWSFAKKKSTILREAAWHAKLEAHGFVDAFGTGDKELTFRMPYLPTGDNQCFLMKAYDEFSTTEAVNFQDLVDSVAALSDNRVLAGVGYLKFANGTLLQYGTTFENECLFSLPFLDDQYTVTLTYEGELDGVTAAVSAEPGAKTATKCRVKAFDAAGAAIGVGRVKAPCNYVAIGRWA